MILTLVSDELLGYIGHRRLLSMSQKTLYLHVLYLFLYSILVVFSDTAT